MAALLFYLTFCFFIETSNNIGAEKNDKQTKTIPKEKFNFLLGRINCHKNGIPNNKMGYADMPSLLLIMVNQ